MAATPSAQPWLWRRNATIRCATATAEQHRTHGQAAKHSTAPGETPELQTTSNRRRRQRRHRRHRELGKNPNEIEPEKIKPQGRDRPRRRTGAIATNGRKTDESPRSDGRAWGDEANAPHGDGTARRSSPESSSIIAGDSQSLERRMG
jgi:hypothetical protein